MATPNLYTRTRPPSPSRVGIMDNIFRYPEEGGNPSDTPEERKTAGQKRRSEEGRRMGACA